jgi:hypothetical protein
MKFIYKLLNRIHNYVFFYVRACVCFLHGAYVKNTLSTLLVTSMLMDVHIHESIGFIIFTVFIYIEREGVIEMK